MAGKVYTDQQDEQTISTVLRHGLHSPHAPKWSVLRLALARSLRIPSSPDERLDRRESATGGSEYSLEQLSGAGKEDAEDFTPLYRALLSVRHEQDLFADDETFVRLLQRHVRRGLREFRSGWMESHDFHDYLRHELFGDVLAASPAPDVDAGERLVRALAEIGISAQVTDRVDGPRLTRFTTRLQDANDHGPLMRGLDKLAFALGLGEAGVFVSPTREPKVAALDVPRPQATWRAVDTRGMRSWLEETPDTFHLPVFVGTDVTGEGFGFDLASAPHLLIGGTTGSGKSICLHAILLSLISRHNADQLKLVLIDPKRVELTAYTEAPHLADGHVITDVEDALDALTALVTEMGQREQALSAAHARDIDDPRAASLHWPRIVVVVEELADLVMQSGAIEEPLVRLAQKARATGIHLVLATQRPDAKTFSGLLRTNVPSRIALTVQKSAESRIILDDTGAEKLLGRGDMLVKLVGQPARRIHGVLVGAEDIAQSIAEAKRR